jgi:endonuclease/exonuclease/phosphatase family metal-dependent hydrolase
VRIISYNILDGGVGRADPIGEVLAAQHADVVILPEADDDYVIDRTARRLQCDVIVGPGRHHRVAVLSRYTIVQTINHALLGSAAQQSLPPCLLEVQIKLPDGKIISIFALHMRSGAKQADEQRRLADLTGVLRVTDLLRKNNSPHILAGDFNSNAVAQPNNLQACKPSTQRAYKANGNVLPTNVVTSILQAGYIDTLAARHAQDAESMHTFSTHHPGQRVDYIFSFNMSRINDAWVERDRLATYASDHYPVGADVDA